MEDPIIKIIKKNHVSKSSTHESVPRIITPSIEDQLINVNPTDITNISQNFGDLQPLVVQLNKGQTDLKKIVRSKTNVIYKSFDKVRELFGSRIIRPDVYNLFVQQNSLSSKIIDGLGVRINSYTQTLKPIYTRLKAIAYDAKQNISNDYGLEKRVKPLLSRRALISTELSTLDYSNPNYYDKIVELSDIESELRKEKFGQSEKDIKQVHFDKRIRQLYLNKGLFEELLGKTRKMIVKVTQYQQIIVENLPILKMTSDLAQQVKRVDGVVDILSDYASEFSRNYNHSVNQLTNMTSSNQSLDRINQTLNETQQLANDVTESERRDIESYQLTR